MKLALAILLAASTVAECSSHTVQIMPDPHTISRSGPLIGTRCLLILPMT